MPVNKAVFNMPVCPEALRTIYNPPSPLYYRGNLPTNTLCIAIVGSRKMTEYGAAAVNHIISGLAGHNITIVSGLAYGVDIYAHRCALAYKLKTIAVLGSGVDTKSIYPSEHKKVCEEIIYNGGGIVSEFPEGTGPRKHHFPMRNRIIAGLSRAVVVIQADIKSGALITAKLANEEGRDVFALPGNVFEQLSQGTNKLLKDGAKVITSAQDILDEYQLNTAAKHAPQTLNFPTNI